MHQPTLDFTRSEDPSTPPRGAEMTSTAGRESSRPCARCRCPEREHLGSECYGCHQCSGFDGSAVEVLDLAEWRA